MLMICVFGFMKVTLFFFYLCLCRTLIMALTAVHKSTRVHNQGGVLTSCRQDSGSTPF